MKFQVSNQVVKQGAKGSYLQCTLTDESGVVHDKINLFNGEATGKTEIEGDLVPNGQYWNFKAKLVYTDNIPQRGGGIAKAQQRKEEGIENAQERKEAGIALAGAITNGTNLTIAESNAGLLEGKDYHTRVRENIIFFQNLYKHPEDINPSSGQVPF